MTKTTMRYELTEQEVLAFEVSDEMLEAAADTVREKAAAYTLAAQRPVCLPRLIKTPDRISERPPRGGLSV